MKNIASRQPMRSAFTLLEVMVAVMIISVVIASLWKMMGNSSHIFSRVKSDTIVGQYSSFLISSKDYGFEDKKIDLYKLTDSFELDSSLRSRLKKITAKLIYTELEVIDLSEYDEKDSDEESDDANSDEIGQEVSSTLAFEIGKSTLKFKDAATSLIRLKIQ